ncbi:MAG: acyl-CoA dehydrogenase family protein [Planctomycetes bacterium]|nr:acyl-CoA dehydrogenase family protein [Planctomycetota bacterium]
MTLREEQQMVLDLVRELARDEVAPRAAAIDHDNAFPEEIFARFRELNLLGLPAPDRYGGIDGDPVLASLVLETIAEASPSVAVVLGLHWSGVLEPVLQFASEPVRESCAPRLARGEALGACSGSVAWGAGAHPTPGAAAAGVFLFGQRPAGSDPEHIEWSLLDRETAGLMTLPSTDPLGWRGSGFASLKLEGAPPAGRAFPTDTRSDMTAQIRNGVALAVAAVALGTGRAAQARALKYAHERRQFGRLIEELGAIRQMLTRSAAALDDAERAVREAARTRAEGGAWGALALQSRRRAAEAAVLASRNAIQVHGGYGYMADYHVERDARDAQCAVLFGGGEGS